MMPSEQEQLDRDVTHVLAEKHAKIVFDDLFEFASDICLPSLPDLETVNPEPAERSVVNQLGVRGMRAVVEMYIPEINISPYILHSEPTEEDEEDPEKVLLTLDAPITHPELFSTILDADVQNKIEAFGSALLAESYKVLGDDVEKQIDTLKRATSVDEQMEIVNWLDARIESMTRDEFDTLETIRQRQDQEFAYQPYRLSPKVIGVYPHHQERPTCLGISIIAASFFKQAGLDTLHAGVGMSGHEMPMFMGLQFNTRLTERVHEQTNILLPDIAQAAIKRTSYKMYDQTVRSDAQHAATYVRLIDGSWAQFDPNYAATFNIHNEKTVALFDSVHEQLEALSPYAPGVEVATMTNDNIHPTSAVFQDVLKELTPEYMNDVRDRAKETLKGLSVTEMTETIFQKAVMPFFLPEEASDDLKSNLFFIYLTEWLLPETEEREPILRTAFHNVVQKYLFWDTEPEAFIHQLETDENYFANRVEDLTNLPFLMMTSITKMEAEDFTPWYTHLLLEIGKPEYRIGAATLSDFALYYDFPLPPSFWQSYWPGSASVIEHLDGDTSIHKDFALSINNSLYHRLHPFTGFKNNGMIKSFLEEADKKG